MKVRLVLCTESTANFDMNVAVFYRKSLMSFRGIEEIKLRISDMVIEQIDLNMVIAQQISD
jgi:hypothetical protein